MDADFWKAKWEKGEIVRENKGVRHLCLCKS